MKLRTKALIALTMAVCFSTALLAYSGSNSVNGANTTPNSNMQGQGNVNNPAVNNAGMTSQGTGSTGNMDNSSMPATGTPSPGASVPGVTGTGTSGSGATK